MTYRIRRYTSTINNIKKLTITWYFYQIFPNYIAQLVSRLQRLLHCRPNERTDQWVPFNYVSCELYKWLPDMGMWCFINSLISLPLWSQFDLYRHCISIVGLLDVPLRCARDVRTLNAACIGNLIARYKLVSFSYQY